MWAMNPMRSGQGTAAEGAVGRLFEVGKTRITPSKKFGDTVLMKYHAAVTQSCEIPNDLVSCLGGLVLGVVARTDFVTLPKHGLDKRPSRHCSFSSRFTNSCVLKMHRSRQRWDDVFSVLLRLECVGANWASRVTQQAKLVGAGAFGHARKSIHRLRAQRVTTPSAQLGNETCDGVRRAKLRLD